jgi:ABC-type tungstate transport system substrate-binding protein
MTHQANMEILPANLKKPERSFYLSWIVLTAFSVPIAYFFSIIILKIVTNIVGDYVFVNGVRHITEDYLAMYALVPSMSVVTGALQYGLLRQYLPRMGWWVFATVAGWFLGVLLIALPGWLGWIDAPLNNLDLIFLLMGSAIGISQWLLLRRRLAQADWWIAANVAGWGLLGSITPDNSLGQFGLFTLGLLPACTTAAALALLMSRVSPAEPQM